MKKRLLLISIFIALCLSFGGFQYYKHQRIHNIFDEIYYEKSDYQNIEFLWRKSVFNNLNDIHITDNDSRMFINIVLNTQHHPCLETLGN